MNRKEVAFSVLKIDYPEARCVGNIVSCINPYFFFDFKNKEYTFDLCCSLEEIKKLTEFIEGVENAS